MCICIAYEIYEQNNTACRRVLLNFDSSVFSDQNADEAEWEAFQKEIAVEVAASTQMTAEEQLEETTDRQLEEIDDQMRAWSRVRDIEIMKDEVEEKLKVKKTVTAEVKQENSDDELDEESLEEFLDWRQKKT